MRLRVQQKNRVNFLTTISVQILCCGYKNGVLVLENPKCFPKAIQKHNNDCFNEIASKMLSSRILNVNAPTMCELLRKRPTGVCNVY